MKTTKSQIIKELINDKNQKEVIIKTQRDIISDLENKIAGGASKATETLNKIRSTNILALFEENERLQIKIDILEKKVQSMEDNSIEIKNNILSCFEIENEDDYEDDEYKCGCC